jgi:lipoprotein-anchoring transpeptidase ErfK/SrfK
VSLPLETTPRRRRRRTSAVGFVLAALVAVGGLTGCQTNGSARADGSSPRADRSTASPEAAPAPAPAARIEVTPAMAEHSVRPTEPVVVRAAHGRLRSVVVRDHKGRTVAGAIQAGGARWRSSQALAVGRAYRVLAVAVNADGKVTRTQSKFHTVEPRDKLTASVAPLQGETVGVGMPVIVYFSAPVTDRAAVERQLKITSTPRVHGSWTWISDREIHYRPPHYWPARAKITLAANLQNVDAGNGVWGTDDRTVQFATGDSIVSVVNVDKHTLKVSRNGHLERTIPVSTGSPRFLTRGGTKVVLSKEYHRIMDSTTIGIPKGSPDAYRLDVYYALRVTWSGEFLHAAPWSVASQGRENVSHGCVGMSTANARWLYGLTHRGDVVRVVGSPRPLEPGNGYTDWNASFKEYKKGSAL